MPLQIIFLHSRQALVSEQTRCHGFELDRAGNINKYFSVQSSLKSRVSESNLKVFQQILALPRGPIVWPSRARFGPRAANWRPLM